LVLPLEVLAPVSGGKKKKGNLIGQVFTLFEGTSERLSFCQSIACPNGF